MTSWHIITGEYPPQPGGVSDYTRSIARGLVAAGDRVRLYAPACGAADLPDAGIEVHRLAGGFGPATLKELDRALDRAERPHRILVQYVPQAFGWKALNLPFCWWLKSRRRDSIWVMFHEVATPLERHQPLVHSAIAVVTRRMASIVAASAERAFVSIPAWEPVLRSLGASLPIAWLPVPSAIPVVDDAGAVERVRRRLATGGEPVVGHFGTYGSLTRPLLEAAVTSLLETIPCRVMLLGRESERVAASLGAHFPHWRERITGTGVLDPRDVSLALSSCDVMLQPYPDGISSRRTSAMAGLAHGRATATTDGALTESIWRESGAVALSPASDPKALGRAAAALAVDRARARQLGDAARVLYDSRFALDHAIAALREPAGRIALVAAS